MNEYFDLLPRVYELAKEKSDRLMIRRLMLREVNRFTADCLPLPKVEWKNPDDLTNAEVNAGINQGKVSAVKDYYKRTGKSLLESKRAVEAYFEKNKLKFHSPAF